MKLILITFLLFTVSACAAHSNGSKNEYQSHAGGQGHPWDKGRSY
jgi:hypothetical protein